MTLNIWEPSDEQKKYLELVVVMSTDCILGKGTDTVDTYIGNLKSICDCIPKRRHED